MSEDPIVQPMSSPKRDFEKLGKNSKAVVGELKEFLASLKGKSPKEMMGAVAESSLAQSLVSSTLIIFALVFAMSAIPYFLKDSDSGISAKLKSDKGEEVSSEAMPVTSASENSSSDDEAGESESTKTPEQKTADILGVGEVADPKANPLDSVSDDLLDGLDDL